MSGSIHKINRNNHYILKLSGSSVLTATISDNGFINNCIPYYKESSKWFKSYLPLNSQFIDYVLYTATYSGSPLQIQQQEESNSISTSDYRKSTSSFYDNRIYKDYNILRLNEKKEQLDNRKENRIYYKTEPNIFNNRSVEEKIYNSERESPIEFSNESIKYNLDGLIDGFSTVTDLNFSNEVLNNYYNNQNYVKKYNSLESVFGFDGKLFLSHKQTVYPNQNYIWNRNRPTYTYSAWIDNQDLRERPGEYVYEYSGEDSVISGSINYDFSLQIGGVRNFHLDENEFFIAGTFSSINFYDTPYISKLKTENLNFSDLFNPYPNFYVNTTTVSGSDLFIGGQFTTISNLNRNRIAAIDKDSGILLSFDPNVNNIVNTLLLSGSNLYIGGTFTTVSGSTRNRIAAVNKDSGALLPFDPNVGSSSVNILLLSGSNLYIGGLFTTISGSTRNRIAAVDKDSGALSPFDPNCNQEVNTLLLSGSNLYLGGNFTQVSGSTRNRIACVDKDSGALSPFDPDSNGRVRTLLLSGSNLYLGGDFGTISGSVRRGLSCVNKDSGALLPFDPNIISGTPSVIITPQVNCLMFSGSFIYAGGVFTYVSDQPYTNFVILNKDSGDIYSNYLQITSSHISSIWPLDSWKRNGIFDNYIHGEYITGTFNNFYAESIIQTIENYEKPFRFLYNSLPLFLQNGSDSFPQSYTKSIWTVPEETNSFPFFNNDNDFLINVKSKYKDYTNIPEYNISNFIKDYSLNTGTYDIYENGPELNNQTIFRTNGNDTESNFNIKKEIDKDVVKVKFNLNCVNLFRPYRNLYPVEKILQTSKLLLENINSCFIEGEISEQSLLDETELIKNFLLEPFVSPGILWNSIKTGYPYIWPYLNSSSSFISSSNHFPFESIYNPLKYLNNINLFSSNYENSKNTDILFKNVSLSGTYYDEKYTDCITNFIKDSTDFFLNTEENYIYFQSRPENQFHIFLSGNIYEMIISLENNYYDNGVWSKPSSISAGPFSLGKYQILDGIFYYSLHLPPYYRDFKNFTAYHSSPTYNKIKISFRPNESKNYTLSEIISSSLVTRNLTMDIFESALYKEYVKENGQNLLKSYNIFEFESFGENDKRWNISGKWEAPVFDFQDASSKFSYSFKQTEVDVIGYGHQFGRKRHGRSNLTLNISDVSGSYSLADAVGFFNRTYELGKIKESLEVNELICIVPYNNTKKYLIKITDEHQNYITNINYFDHYMFPIKYDYKYGTANPYLMYCFESKMILNYDDLSKIWQNVMPSQSFNHEEQILTIIDTVQNNEDLNRLFEDDISWMIFKVKKRSKTNEFNDKHTFNWPYDNFSITEIAKLDVELFYEGIRNTGIEDEPSPISKQNKTRSVRNIEIVDKEEFKRKPKPTLPNEEEQPVQEEGNAEFYDPSNDPGTSTRPPKYTQPEEEFNPGFDGINWVFQG